MISPYCQRIIGNVLVEFSLCRIASDIDLLGTARSCSKKLINLVSLMVSIVLLGLSLPLRHRYYEFALKYWFWRRSHQVLHVISIGGFDGLTLLGIAHPRDYLY